MKKSRRAISPEAILFGLMCVGEFAGLVCLLSFYRVSAKPTLHVMFSSPLAWICLLGGLSAVVASAGSGFLAWRQWQSGSRRGMLAVLMNLIVVASLLLMIEGAVRLAADKRVLGEELGGHLLYPRQWDSVAARYREVLAKARTKPTYIISDEVLGWTIGPARTSENGQYFSSLEGLRSATAGVSLKQSSPGCRIAIVGDSYTFGENVGFDHTYPHLLEQALDSRCQVANFGVQGYGVAQMYLRYLKDIRDWSPDVVILGFINHNVIRTMAVYSFLLFPNGPMPFTEPRFVLRAGELSVVNHPLITSEAVFAKSSIRDLPFIDYDIHYRATEWDRPAWRYLNVSYAFRLLHSLYPPHEPDRPEISTQETEAINREIFLKFVAAVHADGASPMVAYLPAETDYPNPPWTPIGLKVLRDANIPHLDLRDCLGKREPAALFNPPEKGGHYSEEGNRQVAACLLDPILARLDVSATRNGGASPAR